MIATTESDHGGHRKSGSTSGEAILAAFIPTFVTAVVYLAIFAAIRNRYRKIYAPRTFLGNVPGKDRTPQETPDGKSWFHDFKTLSDKFVLQHNSLDAYLYLRFLKFIVGICFLGCCMSWPILFPINATGGGKATQLDRISFSNISKEKKNYLWAHLVVAWGFFFATLALIGYERLRLIGIRQAYFLETTRSARLSSRTVLFLNAPPEACQPENAEQYFGTDVEKTWPIVDTGDLEELIAARSGTAFALEKAEVDHILTAVKHRRRDGPAVNGNGTSHAEDGHAHAPNGSRPTKRKPPIVGSKFDLIERTRNMIGEISEKIEAHRASPSRNYPERSAIFVAFTSQAAAHRSFQKVSFPPPMPMEDRFLAVLPKEALWKNLAMPVSVRLSKASLGLAFVIIFTIFFSIPVGLIGTISNAQYLAENYNWLSWLNDLPPVVLNLLTGFVPPYLTSYFVSYVPKLFRHIAKLSGEPTVPQAELKTQAWYFVFQVFQVFLITTLSSGAASVVGQIAQHPEDAPQLLAEGLPKASNFYLTYFLLQGLAKSADTVLNYSDLFTYLFYERFMDKTPREKFGTHAQMKGTPWASWYPKFTNFLVIAIAYSCIAPLMLGFASVGVFLYYLAYRYQMLYVCQTKVDTKGEAYTRALRQMPTGIYIAELCLIGLFGAHEAAAQTTLMILTLIFTAGVNVVLDRILRPLELYLGVDVWHEQEPLLAQEDGVPDDDQAALHGASHARRLGLIRLPSPAPRAMSDFFDSIMSNAREQAKEWLHDPSAREEDEDFSPLKDEELQKAYQAPAFTSKTPKLWLPKDDIGVSKDEIEQNKAAGIATTDEGAEVDENGKLHWDHKFENVPIWSKPKQI